MKTYILILLLSSVELLSQSEYKTKSPNEKFVFTADYQDYYSNKLLEACITSQKTLEATITKLPNNALTIYIQLGGEPPINDNWRTLFFSRTDLLTLSSHEILHKINTSLIDRLIHALSESNNQPAPEWLIAAITHDIQLGRNTLLTHEKYPITRHTLINGTYPDVDWLLTTQDIPPSTFLLYQIYAEQCSIALHGFKKQANKKILANYLSQKSKISFIDYLSQHDNSLKTSVQRRHWYIDISKKTCYNIINPYPADYIQKKIDDLFSVTIARPSSNGSEKVPLEELSDHDDKVLDNFYLQFIQTDFFEIYLHAPHSLKPALNEFILALEELKQNNTKKFKQKIKISKQNFKRAVEYQLQLSAYLNKLEDQHSIAFKNHSLFLQVEQKFKAKRQELFKAWHSYLNYLEKKLANTQL